MGATIVDSLFRHGRWHDFALSANRFANCGQSSKRFAPVSTLYVGLLYGGATLFAMFAGMPIAFALGAVAIVFMFFFMPAASLDTVTQNVFEEMASITLLSIPLFILKGSAIGRSRAGQDLYGALHAWMHRIPGGLGIANVFACALFAAMAGINLIHVPYKGTAVAFNDVLGGHVEAMVASPTTAVPYIYAGRLRALATTGAQRSPALPDLPTAEEQGTKDLIAYTWNAIFAPKALPADILQKLNKAAVDAINTPAVKDKLAGLGAEIATGNETTPGYLGKLVKDETEKWAVPIKASGVTVE